MGVSVGRFDSSRAVVHENVAVLRCDNGATLAETMRLLEGLALPSMSVGDTALVFPADRFAEVQAALHCKACYPKVVGEAPMESVTVDEES